MESVIIQLARKHAINQVSRGEWVNNCKGVVINEGDEIQMQSGYVDLNPSNSNTITIEETFYLSFSYVPYICVNGDYIDGNFIENDTNNTTFPSDTPYYAVDVSDPDPNKWKPYEKTIDIVIEKNVYSPAGMAEYITDKINEIKFTPGGGFPRIVQPSGFVEDFILSAAAATPDPYFGKNLRFVQWSYPPITASTSVNTPLVVVPFVSGAAPYCVSQYMNLGATQAGLAFSTNQFKWFFLQPYYQTGKPTNIWCVEYSYVAPTGNPPPIGNIGYNVRSSLGGVILTNVNDNYKSATAGIPNKFLSEILGLNPVNYVIPIEDFSLTTGQFNNKYPASYPSYTTTLKTSTALVYQNGVYKSIVDTTIIPTLAELSNELGNYIQTGVVDLNYGEYLTGSNILNLEGGGHFILSLNSVPQNTLLRDRGQLSISMIIPKQYTSSNTVTGFSDNSPIYTHVGEPITLNMIRVALINPGDNRIVNDYDLGDNSYFYLQINRRLQIPVPIKEKRKLKKKGEN